MEDINLDYYHTVFVVVTNFYTDERDAVTFREVGIAELDLRKNVVCRAIAINVRAEDVKLMRIPTTDYYRQKMKYMLPDVKDHSTCSQDKMRWHVKQFIGTRPRLYAAIVYVKCEETAALMHSINEFIPLISISELSTNPPPFEMLDRIFGQTLADVHSCRNHILEGYRPVWRRDGEGKVTLRASAQQFCAMTKAILAAMWLGTEVIGSTSIKLPMRIVEEHTPRWIHSIE
jgi:hypothetical protein